MMRYINGSLYGPDYLYQKYLWLNRLAVNNYQLLTVIWNLLLVVIPYVIVLFLGYYWRQNKFKKIHQILIALFFALLWLLFIPNTAYIITEVRHLLNYCPTGSPFRVCVINAWMILFFFSYAGVGWVAFYYLLRQAGNFLTDAFNKNLANFFIVAVMPLISLGVLLGLINRWNSWDVFIYPGELINIIIVYFTNFNYLLNWLAFTTFLYILYFAGSYLFKDRQI